MPCPSPLSLPAPTPPKGFVPEWTVPQGAEEADGIDSLIRTVRDQIGRGADWIKLYGDYRWGPHPGSHPTFSLDEMKLAVATAKDAGVPVAVHTSTVEGMRRATLPAPKPSSMATMNSRNFQADGGASCGALPSLTPVVECRIPASRDRWPRFASAPRLSGVGSGRHNFEWQRRRHIPARR